VHSLQTADALGSAERLNALVEQAPAGTMIAIGTEIHLVNRLAKRFAAKNKKIITLDDTGCFARRCTSACSTRLGDFRLLRAKMRNVEIFYGSPKDRATFARKPASYRLTSRGFPEL
jgi:quinolinate synthase